MIEKTYDCDGLVVLNKMSGDVAEFSAAILWLIMLRNKFISKYCEVHIVKLHRNTTWMILINAGDLKVWE